MGTDAALAETAIGRGDVHGELTRKIRELTTLSRTVYAELVDTVGELEREGTANAVGYSTLAALLMDVALVGPGEAKRMVRHAEHACDSTTLTGIPVPTPRPLLREALHEGAISAEHVEIITTTIDQIPDWAPTDHAEIVERTLTDTARVAHPRVVRGQARHLLARIDQDGARPRDDLEQERPGNTLRTSRTLNGRMRLTGELDPEAAEELDSLLGALVRPHSDTPGAPDPRSQTERNGDALADIIHRALTTPDLPQRGGDTPRLTVLLDLDTLINGVGAATLDSGCPLAPSAVRRLACDAQIVPMVLDGDSVPLDLGRSHRLVTPAQRAALSARDRGCAFPNCDRPARWTDAHHVKSWIDGGPTDLHNLVLLCRRHHRTIHRSEWVVRIVGGLPEFIPPRWLDPNQKPLRNTLHPPPQAPNPARVRTTDRQPKVGHRNGGDLRGVGRRHGARCPATAGSEPDPTPERPAVPR